MIKVSGGGKVAEIPVAEKMTVADALKTADITPSKKATISVNNVDATLKTPVKDEDIVVVTPRPKNG